MHLRRVENVPVLTLRGRPRLSMIGAGELRADRLELELRESAADGSEDDLLPFEIVPQRMVALGHVALTSAQMIGKVDRLEVDLEYLQSELVLGSPSGEPGKGLGSLAAAGSNFLRAYHAGGQKMQLGVKVREGRPDVNLITVVGNVEFREESKDPTAQPMRISADQLQVTDADTPEAKLSLSGQPASITAAGMTLLAPELKLNRGTSRAWIPAPGQLQMLVERDMQGKPLTTPQPLAIEWQQQMELDHDRITIQGNVKARSADGLLETTRLVALLTEPIQFDGVAQHKKVEIKQIECWEGVAAQFSQRDAGGVTSINKLDLESITANQQTGEIKGVGPGSLESVHLADDAQPNKRFPDVAPPGQMAMAAARRGPSQRLRFMRVEFDRGVSGNLHRRHVNLLGNVQAVAGPVDSWQQRLETTLHGTPRPETIWITSQELGLNENPLIQRPAAESIGPVELVARGNVTIEGEAGGQGFFTARAHEAKYDQQKTTFILEGNGQQPATLALQKFLGAPASEWAARRLTYTQSTGEVTSEGIVKGQWNDFNLGK